MPIASTKQDDPDADLTLKITVRERDTMLAALRLWQSFRPSNPDLRDIATNGGAHSGLDHADIDELCESINISPEGRA